MTMSAETRADLKQAILADCQAIMAQATDNYPSINRVAGRLGIPSNFVQELRRELEREGQLNLTDLKSVLRQGGIVGRTQAEIDAVEVAKREIREANLKAMAEKVAGTSHRKFIREPRLPRVHRYVHLSVTGRCVNSRRGN